MKNKDKYKEILESIFLNGKSVTLDKNDELFVLLKCNETDFTKLSNFVSRIIFDEKMGLKNKFLVKGELPKIKKVIFNEPYTIVLWEDGTKTVVKCNNENFDKEKGLAMAISKKTLGNNGSYFEVFKKYCDEQNDAEINIKDEMKKCLDKFYDIILKRNSNHEE